MALKFLGDAVSKAAADQVVEGLTDSIVGKKEEGEQEKKGGFDVGDFVQKACGGDDDKGGFDVGGLVQKACGGDDDKGGFNVGGLIQKACGGDEDKGGLDVGEVVKDVGAKVVQELFK